jgi:hypothetical protein
MVLIFFAVRLMRCTAFQGSGNGRYPVRDTADLVVGPVFVFGDRHRS